MARKRCAVWGMILLCALTSGARAQVAPAAGDSPAVHAKKTVHKKPTSTTVKPAAPSSDTSERAAALARERRNFFAHDKTDPDDSDSAPAGGPRGSSGAYLGGGSGLTPGMQFQF